MKQVLGIDVGGTNLRGAVVNEKGEIFSKKQTKSDAKEGIDKVVKNLVAFIEDFNKFKPSAIGIGFPGIINHKKGILIQSPNISGGTNFPILKVLKRHLSTQVVIENDANCIALGEFWKGSGNGCDSMIMIAIGTGLGGGIILDGELWQGENCTAGEIGHMIIDTKGPKCSCGSSGCLESFVSAEAVRRVVSNSNGLTKKTRETDKDDIPRKIMELAENKDEESINLWKQFGSYLGIGITNLINILNVENIVIGGGLSNAWEFFIDSAKSEIEQKALEGSKSNLNIHKAKLGDNAGILGSAYMTLRSPYFLKET